MITGCTIPISTREAIPQQHTFIKAAEMIHLDLRISTFLQLKKEKERKKMLMLSSFSSLKPAPLGPSVPCWCPSCPHGSQTPPPNWERVCLKQRGPEGIRQGRGPSWELSFLVWSTAGFLLKQTFFATFSLCVPSNILLQFPTQKKSLKKKKGKG